MMAPSSATSVLTTNTGAAMASSTSSPCAACKFLRRKCQPDCIFAPYFPPDQPQKFAHVHKIFGASNVTKLLNELTPYQREDAVNSLAYEAEMRLRDPVYGCVGVISILQHQLRQLQMDLSCAKSELSKYQASATSALVNVNKPVNFRGIAVGREHHHHILMRGYEAEMGGGVGSNAGYDAGFMAAAMNMSAGLGALSGQFSKARAADERQAIGPP
ncbi:protein ASYMMETRIC LEAVES 2-like [Wolffia australiana]